MLSFLSFQFLFLSSISFAQVGSVDNLVYQGRIASGGAPLSAGVTTFEVSIFGGASNCLLYRETFTKDMTSSSGHYSFPVGGGLRTDTLFGGGAPSHSLSDALRNIGTISNLDCGGSSGSFSPALTHDRRFQIRFNPSGSGWVSLPSQAIKSAPYAMQAMQVNGYGVSNLAKIGGSGASTVMSPAGWAKIMDYSELGNLILGAGTAITCDSSRAGGVRYNAGSVEFCNGTAWTALATGSAGISALTGDVTATGTGSVSATIANGAVNSAKILDGAVTTIDIADGAITAANLNQMSATSGQVLKWNGTAWAPAADDNSSTPAWSAITAKPTTLAGYGITDAMSSTLNSGLVWVGNGSNVANSRFLNISDIKSSVSGNFLTASGACAAGSGLSYSSVTDTISCQAESLTSSQVTTALGFTPASSALVVLKAGDTMTGTLNLPNNGLVVGTNQLVVSGGSLGVGTASPAASSLMELNSTTKGVLIPRLTTAQRDAIATPANGLQIYNTTTNQLNYFNGSSWQALGVAGSGISSLTAGTGLTGGTITTSGTVSVDAGTGPNQIVQLNASSQLPAVSGANLTNLSATNLAAGTLPAARLPGFTGDVTSSAGTSALSIANDAVTYAKMQNVSATSRLLGRFSAGAGDIEELSLGSGLSLSGGGVLSLSTACSANQVLQYNGTTWACVNSSSFGTANAVVNNGNSYAGTMTVGTNDNNELRFETNGTDKMTVLANGNVGVGTISPSNKFSVVGASSFTGTSSISPTNGLFELYNNTPAGIGEGAMMVFSADHSGGKTSRAAIKGGSEFISSNYGGFLAFYTNRQVAVDTLNERMRISSGGNVGIATTTPAQQLDVNGNTIVRGNLTVSTSSHNGDIYAGNTANPSGVGRFAYLGWDDTALKARLATGGTYPLTLEVASTERMRIDSAGNVGIGTTNPSAILDIASTTSGVLIPRLTTAQRDSVLSPATGLQVYNTTTNQLNFYNGSSWQALGVSGAGISSLTAGTGLTGGTITTSGTVAVDVGTTANKVVQLNASAELPAVSGVNLTNLNASNVSAGTLSLSRGGTGASSLTANRMVMVNGTGTALTNDACTVGQILKYNGTMWACAADDSGGGGGITALTGDVTATGSGSVAATLAANSVTSAKIADGTIASVDLAAGVAAANLGFNPVNRAGDTMTGTLNLPSNGLAVGTNQMVVTGGNVGIGTNSPGYKLSIAGDASISWLNTAIGIIDSSGGGLAYSIGSRNGVGFHIGDETAGQSRLVINSSGNVGVGTTTPSAKLDVNGIVKATAFQGDGSGLTGITANSVAWTNVSGRPTGVSSFSNDAGYLTNTSMSGLSINTGGSGGPNIYGAGGGAAMLSFHRPGNYAVNFGLDADNVLKVGGWSMGGVAHTIWHAGNLTNLNQLTNGPGYVTAADSVNYANSAGSANSVAWTNVSGRPTNVSSFTNDSGYVTAGGSVNYANSAGSANSVAWGNVSGKPFNWSGQGGQPTWLWGSNDGSNYYVWNPSNFSVNYANSAGSAATVSDNSIGSSKVIDGSITPADTNFTNQGLTTGHSPTFADIYTNAWYRVNGGNGIYWEAYGGGWQMTDATWIRSYGSKSLYMGNGSILTEPGASVTSGAFYYNSDARLKHDVQPGPGLEFIKQLRGVRFKWNSSNQDDIGLIAQEVQQAAPELVTKDKMNGNLSVKYGNLVSPLIEAVKELDLKCEMSQGLAKKLESRIAAEEKKNREQDRSIASLKDSDQKLQTKVDALSAENLLLRKELNEIKQMLKKQRVGQ